VQAIWHKRELLWSKIQGSFCVVLNCKAAVSGTAVQAMLLFTRNVINLKKNFTNTYHWVSDRGQLIKNEDDILD